MNAASVWRQGLAQQLAPYYRTNPKVATMAIEGSVARGYADRSSDLDLAVFWTEPPTKKERRDIIVRVGGRLQHLSPAYHQREQWSEKYEVGGVTIDMRHTTVETLECLLVDVLERADPSLPKQQRLAALLSALPLSNPSVLTRWQQRASAYSRELSVAMVQAHLRFRPAWEQEMKASRHDLLTLYESLCTVEKHILLVLMGLNRIYYPGFQWVDQLMEQMPITPPDLAPRLHQAFSIVSIDPLAGVYRLHDLVEETFGLVETHLGELDTAQARTRFRQPR
jgi:predicted nucleotidyltransferase